MNSEISKMPCIQLSKENLKLMKDFLSNEEIGKMMLDIYDYVYVSGEEPDYSTNKTMSGVWNNVIAFVTRRAEKWLNKTKNFRENNPNKKETEGKVKIFNSLEEEIDSYNNAVSF